MSDETTEQWTWPAELDALPPHSLENVGETELRNITVELKPLI
jgi:hypothetical protein